MTKSGAADLILTGSDTYSGATTISGGTLQLGNATTGGSINCSSVTNNSVFAFDRSNSITFSPAIGGTGALLQAGSNALILTGNDTYSGATTISAGTLQIGNGGTTGSIGSTTSVSDSGVLAFDQFGQRNLLAGRQRPRQPASNGRRRPDPHRQQHLQRRHHGRRRHHSNLTTPTPCRHGDRDRRQR